MNASGTVRLSLIDNIKQSYNNAVVRFCEETHDQRVRIQGFSKYVILRGERLPGNTQRICDCIIFLEYKGSLFLVVIELKSRVDHANEIVDKLQNCTNTAINIARELNFQGHELKYLPLLFLPFTCEK